MSKKEPPPSNMYFGLGIIPTPTNMIVPPRECREVYAYGVPPGVCVALTRIQQACGQELQGPVCGPCGPLVLDAEEPCGVITEGCYIAKISNPENADLSRMAIFCYETKATPPNGVVMAQAGTNVSEVKEIVELCLVPIIARLDAVEAVNAAQQLVIDDHEPRITANKTCLDEILAPGVE